MNVTRPLEDRNHSYLLARESNSPSLFITVSALRVIILLGRPTLSSAKGRYLLLYSGHHLGHFPALS